MLALNPNPAITEELFNTVVKSITRLCKKASMPGNTKMVLTEGDLQAWIFHHLLSDLRRESGWGNKTDSKQIGIHCNPYFLDEEGKLSKVPDIVILDKQEYSVNPSDGLYERKGYTLWGSSIMLELKLFRTSHNEDQKLKEWKADIDKLMDLRSKHYPLSNPEKFFPAFVLLGRRSISAQTLAEVRQYAVDKSVEPLLFNTTEEH